MANIFGDNPPNDFIRGNKGWLKSKPSGAIKRLSKLKVENAELRARLEQLEVAVSEITSKKGKK